MWVVTFVAYYLGTNISDKNVARVFRVETTLTLKVERVNFSKLWNYVKDCIVPWNKREDECFDTEWGS
jgi:hypothetical protein